MLNHIRGIIADYGKLCQINNLVSSTNKSQDKTRRGRGNLQFRWNREQPIVMYNLNPDLNKLKKN